MTAPPNGSEIEIHFEDGIPLPVEVETLRRALALVLERENAAGARLSLALVGDAGITRLNREYLGHEGPTDVISFPLHLPAQPPVGDIYVGVEQAIRQAEEAGVAISEELLRLAIHGALHVLGHDHPEGEERYASGMYRRQEELLAEALTRTAGER